MLASMFALSASASLVDVSEKFVVYAQGYCSGGNVKNADIGNGDLARRRRVDPKSLSDELLEAYVLGQEHAKLGKERLLELGLRTGEPVAADAIGDNAEESDNGGFPEVGGCDESSGNTCQESGGLYHWCNYSQYKCMSKYSGQEGYVTYSNMLSTAAPPQIVQYTWDNAQSTDDTFTFDKSYTSSHTQSISTTYGFNIGESLEISASVPDIMSVKETFSWSFDWHETDTDSETTTDEFSWNESITNKANTTTLLQVTISQESYSGEWQAEIGLPYYAKIWCNDKTNDHYEWFIPAGNFMGAGPYYGSGSFTGGAGTKIEGTVCECALYERDASSCTNPTTGATCDLPSRADKVVHLGSFKRGKIPEVARKALRNLKIQ